MDPLTQVLLARASQPPIQPDQAPQAQAGPSLASAQAPVPAIPPNPQAKVPQAAKRFSNAQAIMDAYRQGWSPNPVLLQATLGNK